MVHGRLTDRQVHYKQTGALQTSLTGRYADKQTGMQTTTDRWTGRQLHD